jgi:hypothetical protein
MGQYNPHKPSILGQEWTPVKEMPFQLSTEEERGVTFILDHAATVVSGAVYIDEVPASQGSTKGIMMAVYEAGTEHLTGPIQRVTVPPVSGFWRSLDSSNPLDIDLDPGNITFAQAIEKPNDYAVVNAEEDGEIYVLFDTSTVTTQLSGKRILELNLLYVMSGTQSGIPGPLPDTPVSHDLWVNYGNPDTGSLIVSQGNPEIALTGSNVAQVSRVKLGNSMIFDMQSTCSNTPFWKGSAFFPLRSADVGSFDTGTPVGTRLTIEFRQNDGCSGCTSVSLPSNHYSYMALEILYCEERRLLYGGRGRWPCANWLLDEGQNKIMLKPADTFGLTGKVLTPGEYTVTVSMADMGDYQNNIGGNYSATGLLQEYALPTHTGLVVDTRAVEGGTFSRSTSNLLPRVTLHTASGVVTGVHDYDTLADGTVYDGVIVTSGVVERANGTADQYPQVRFYARRFGDTNVPLVLRRVSTPTQRVEITADEFDALPEIVDGWREVTLRFADSVIPTFGNSGAVSNWEWVATGLEANNQWEILIPVGLTATSGPFYAGPATYGGTAAVTTVGAETLNSSADSTLIFSQDPPAVTGFAAEIAEQSLEPIGDECQVDPKCVATGLLYNHLTWDARDVLDLFEDRTTSDDWGDADSGQTWVHSGGTADDYFVVTGAAHMTIDAVNTIYFSTIEAQAYNAEIHGVVRIPVVPTGAGVTARVAGRVEDTSNYYEAQLTISTAGVASLNLTKRVGGTGAVISATATLDGTHTAGDAWHIVLRPEGDNILGQAWKDGYPRPLNWQVVGNISIGDSILGTQAGVAFRAESGFAGGTIVVEWLEFSSENLDITAFELQRSDDVDDEWQTIMLSTGTAVNEFNDYEARVGITSYYRMRTVNALGFNGEWTPQGSTTLYSFDVSDEGWVGEGPTSVAFTTEQTHDGAGALAATETLGSGTVDMRFNDAAGVRDLSASGNTVTAWILVPEKARGTGWQARLEVQDPAFAWIPGSFFELTPGLWTPIRFTPPAGLLANCRAIGFHVEAADVNGTQTIYVDTVVLTFDAVTLPAPGVTGLSDDGNSVLIFTTNERQDGSSNLAYVMTWDSDITEEFSYPEAGTVQLRDVFRRNFPIAFRPEERGGERFSRDIIVQNAAVPSGLMRDGFRSLRDMAWEDVSYVAVRNELGDRWFANVNVPTGRIKRNRRLYIARIDIVEVSETPSVVDPGA